jgi:hypothetical protein
MPRHDKPRDDEPRDDEPPPTARRRLLTAIVLGLLVIIVAITAVVVMRIREGSLRDWPLPPDGPELRLPPPPRERVHVPRDAAPPKVECAPGDPLCQPL